MLHTIASFNIRGPAPVGTGFGPEGYSDFNMREVKLAVVNTVGQLNYSFLTNMRLDETKKGMVIWSPDVLNLSGTVYYLAPTSNETTETYIGDNQSGYNWRVDLLFNLKNAGGSIIDLPAGDFPNLTIQIDWNCKAND